MREVGLAVVGVGGLDAIIEECRGRRDSWNLVWGRGFKEYKDIKPLVGPRLNEPTTVTTQTRAEVKGGEARREVISKVTSN